MVALPTYRVWITKEEVVKLRSLYIKCFKFVLSSMYSLWITKQEVVRLRSLFVQVCRVSLSMYQAWFTKEKVVKMRNLDIKCLKLRCLCIECGSLKIKM